MQTEFWCIWPRIFCLYLVEVPVENKLFPHPVIPELSGAVVLSVMVCPPRNIQTAFLSWGRRSSVCLFPPVPKPPAHGGEAASSRCQIQKNRLGCVYIILVKKMILMIRIADQWNGYLPHWIARQCLIAQTADDFITIPLSQTTSRSKTKAAI